MKKVNHGAHKRDILVPWSAGKNWRSNNFEGVRRVREASASNRMGASR